LLDNCLQSIQSQGNYLIPIIVIDNASTDNTKRIVEKWQETITNITYVFESKPGLSYARNCMMDAVTTEYMHYIDDDTVLPKDFIDNLISFLKKYQPVAYTGKIIPSFNGKKPKWYKDKYLSGSNVDLKTGLLSDGFLMGGNMGFKTERLKILGGFPTDFGKGSSKMYGEETYLENKLKQLNIDLHYSSEILLYHYGNDDTIFKVIKMHYHHLHSNIVLRQFLNIKHPYKTYIFYYSKELAKNFFNGFLALFRDKNYYIQNWIIDISKSLFGIYVNVIHWISSKKLNGKKNRHEPFDETISKTV